MNLVGRSKIKILVNCSFLMLSIFAPLLSLPYLSRVLGQDTFGLYLSVLSLMGFLVIFCEFGFNISSAKRLALTQDSNIVRSEVIFTTTLIKFFLTLLAGIFYLVFIFNVSNYSRLQDISLPVIFLLASLSMQPAWYFIGAEKLIINSVFVAMGRILPLGFLFYLVRDKGDFELAIWIQSIGMFLCCFASYLYIGIKENIFFKIPSIEILISYVRSDYMLFFSNLLIGLYASLNAVLLGIKADFIEVATYAAIERIFKTIESIIVSTASIFFPSIARKMVADQVDAAKDIRTVVKFYFLVGVSVIILTICFGSELLELLYGGDFDYGTNALYIFMFIPIVGCLSTAWANLGLLVLGKNTLFFKIILFGAALNVILIMYLGSDFGAVGGAISILAATAVIAFQMKFHLNKHISESGGGV